MRKSLLAILSLAICAFLAGQQTLDNDAVVRLVKAGISEDLIVSTISAKPGAYDISANGIAALKNAGASEKVVSAVLAKGLSPRKTDGSNTGIQSNRTGYTLEYVHSDKKIWLGPERASDKYDEISGDIRNGLIEALSKKGLRHVADTEPHCCKLTVDLLTVKTKVMKHGGLGHWSVAVEVSTDLRFEDDGGHILYEKVFPGWGEESGSGYWRVPKNLAVTNLAEAIASDEGFLKALRIGDTTR
jgi:hypothetical protein